MIHRCEQQNSDWDSLALGALPAEEALRLEAHLAGGCLVCRSRYEEACLALTALPLSLPEATPGDAVEQRLARYVKATPKPARVISFPVKTVLPWSIAAASLACAFWLGSHRPEPVRLVEVRTDERVVDPNPELLNRIAQLEAAASLRPTATPAIVEKIVEREKPVPVSDPRVAELEAEIARLRQAPPVVQRVVDPQAAEQLKLLDAKVRELEGQLSRQARQFELLQARHTRESQQWQSLLADYRNAFRTIESNGMKQVELARIDQAAGQSAARALYSRDGGLLVLAHDLPPLPAKKCYQLWILRKGNPSIVSGGLIKLDEQGRGFLQSPPTVALRDATGFAITDEPEGGSVVARGKKLLFGAL
jgi:hypothetical protein